jgi:hypothetical protein
MESTVARTAAESCRRVWRQCRRQFDLQFTDRVQVRRRAERGLLAGTSPQPRRTAI